jgi:type IV pilus assembly protein PilA
VISSKSGCFLGQGLLQASDLSEEMTDRDNGGFTLIELAVVVMIAAVLIAIAIPTFFHMRDAAHDRAAQSLARDALNVELGYYLDSGTFTTTRATLKALEPSLIWNQAGDPPGTVRIRLNAGRASYEVCIYALSKSGAWFGIYRNENTGTIYGQPDQLRGCAANTVTRHWDEGW